MEAVLEIPSITAKTATHPLRMARLAVAMLFFLNGAIFATWVSRIPAVQSRLGMSHGALGIALLCMAFGALVAMPAAGKYSARFGSHRVTQWCTVIFCAALPLLVLAPNPPLLMLALFLFGTAHGAIDVAMNAQAIAVENHYGRPIMSSFHALFSTGGLVGAASGGLIASLGVTPTVHFFAATLLLGGITALVAFPRLLDARETESIHLLDEPEASPRFAWPSRTLVVLGIVAFCSMAGEGAMADWSAIFLNRFAGASEGAAAAGYAAFSIAMALCRFSGDWLTERLGPSTIVRLSGCIAAAGLAFALAISQPIASLIGFAAVGVGFATVVPQVFSAAGRTAGMSAGVAVATVSTMGYFGFLIGPPVIGFAAQMTNLRTALLLIVFTSCLLILLAPSVRRSPEL